VLAAAVLVASQVGFVGFEPDADVMALVTVIANIVLRFATKQGVVLKLRV
jgi:hypothetical protein